MKRIVICCDGTWNTPKQVDRGVWAPTNVWQLKELILPVANGVEQRVYYHPGVGTHGNWPTRVWDAITGLGVSSNIRDAYRFVIRNFELGDQLFLFGFSRGAFTARSLAGLIRWCGILRPDAINHVQKAFNFYRLRDDADRPRTEAAKKFREEYAVEDISPIEFIGVWDTVGALGNPLLIKFGNKFHDVTLSTMVHYAYQAVAIDEKRRSFRPTLWKRQPPPPTDMQARAAQAWNQVWRQTVEQAWFCGVHCGVGGGYKQTGLSNVALQWMIEKARQCGLGIKNQYIATNAFDVLRESRIWFWRCLGRLDRPLADPAVAAQTCESLHSSVAARWNDTSGAVPRYRPPNLEKYYDRNPP